MARGKGKNSWAHNWFCKEDKCLYVAPQSGEVCGVEKGKRNCIDRAAHLKAHNVTEETPLPTKQGTRNILAALAAACPPLDALEKIYVLMALRGMSNKIVNCPVWRDFTNSLISRNFNLKSASRCARQATYSSQPSSMIFGFCHQCSMVALASELELLHALGIA
jgi:hypothetical protein